MALSASASFTVYGWRWTEREIPVCPYEKGMASLLGNDVINKEGQKPQKAESFTSALVQEG